MYVFSMYEEDDPVVIFRLKLPVMSRVKELYTRLVSRQKHSKRFKCDT